MTTASRTRCRWPTSTRRPASSPPPTQARPERRDDDRHDGVADAIVPGSGARGRGRGLLPRVGTERGLDRLAAGHPRGGRAGLDVCVFPLLNSFAAVSGGGGG